jgi:hypothetical protein
MSLAADVRVTTEPRPAAKPPEWLRWVCTNNPFYVLSAGLFLIGLWLSFGAGSGDVEAWALMSCLAGYTLLLAVTACLLVRFGNVWDDVRTVLLLVVLMFLATSVTFDEALVLHPARGFTCSVVGLLFAVAVTEGLLRGIRLRLPEAFRVPYYLTLALFFLYPPAISPLTARPRSEELMWVLFGFSTAAGLVFLTLLPAARRGPDYVRGNGSPWPWPLYPWSLFVFLGVAVVGRAFLLCWSMHLLGAGDRDRLIFGPYFLVPFGLAVTVVLLEIGLTSRSRGTLRTALAMPLGLVALTLIGNRYDPIYRTFLGMFTARLGGDPLWVTLLACAAFYTYASLRRVSLAIEGLTAVLVALAFIGPDTLTRHKFGSPQPAPLLVAAALQLALGIRQRDARRFLIGLVALAAAGLAMPAKAGAGPERLVIAFHLALAAILVAGAVFPDAFGQRLRVAGAALGLLACVVAVFGPFDRDPSIPAWMVLAYPPILSSLLAGYGWLLRHRPSQAAAGVGATFWLAAAGMRGYRWLRQVVAGLDHIAGSLALFALAVLISLIKSGLLARWLEARYGKAPSLEALTRAIEAPEQRIVHPEDRVEADGTASPAAAAEAESSSYSI